MVVVSVIPAPRHTIKPGPVVYHCSAVVGEKLYILTGLKTDKSEEGLIPVFNFSDNKWDLLRPKGKIPSPRCLSCCTVVGEKIYVFGGYQITSAGVHKCFNGLYVYDTASNVWEHIVVNGNSPDPRAGATMIYYHRRLWVYGGSQGRHVFFGDLFCFNLKTNTWSNVVTSGAFPKRRCCHTANLIGSRMYLFGGITADSSYKDQKLSNDLFYLDFKSMEWYNVKYPAPKKKEHSISLASPRPLVPEARCCHVSVSAGDSFLIACGGDLLGSYSEEWEDDYFDDVYIFNTLTDEWKKVKQSETSLPNCIGMTCNYDGTHHRLLFFGGKRKTGTCMSRLFSLTFDSTKKHSFIEKFFTAISSSKNIAKDEDVELSLVTQDIKEQLHVPTPETPLPLQRSVSFHTNHLIPPHIIKKGDMAPKDPQIILKADDAVNTHISGPHDIKEAILLDFGDIKLEENAEETSTTTTTHFVDDSSFTNIKLPNPPPPLETNPINKRNSKNVKN